MFNEKVVVRITPPVDVPVIVTVKPETTGAVALAVRVNVEVDAGTAGVTGFGVNAEAVTPVGRPDIDRVTVCTPAPVATSRAETVEGALVVPGARVTAVGATLRL